MQSQSADLVGATHASPLPGELAIVRLTCNIGHTGMEMETISQNPAKFGDLARKSTEGAAIIHFCLFTDQT